MGPKKCLNVKNAATMGKTELPLMQLILQGKTAGTKETLNVYLLFLVVVLMKGLIKKIGKFLPSEREKTFF